MILHVDLDAFFASVEQRDNPALRGKPVIVGNLLTRGVVATASYEARKFGVHSAMPLSRAKALCPQAIFIPGNFVKYEKASKQFSEICSQFSPVIEQVSLDELYMDMIGTESLYSPLDVAHKIQDSVSRQIGITCSVGISAQKTIAKIASGFKKPNGITNVPVGKEKEFLALMEIRELPGCGKQTQKLLNDLGIKTVSQLSKMERTHIEVLMEKQGLYLWRVANGIDDSQVVPPANAKSVSRSITFALDTNNRKFIESMFLYLANLVGRDLREMKVTGRCITITIRTLNFETFSMQETISGSTSTASVMFIVIKRLLNKLWDGNTELRLIGVSVSSFNQLKSQTGLFDLFEKNKKLLDAENAMDAIRTKYGFLSITPASVFRLKKKIE